eukprot:gene20549-biopygen10115
MLRAGREPGKEEDCRAGSAWSWGSSRHKKYQISEFTTFWGATRVPYTTLMGANGSEYWCFGCQMTTFCCRTTAASPGSCAFALWLPHASIFVSSIGSVKLALGLNWRSQWSWDAAGWQGAGSREQGAG